jgi:hypothetical protein
MTDVKWVRNGFPTSNYWTFKSSRSAIDCPDKSGSPDFLTTDIVARLLMLAALSYPGAK